jgi:Spy/CpxP family protein refolding chaperone
MFMNKLILVTAAALALAAGGSAVAGETPHGHAGKGSAEAHGERRARHMERRAEALGLTEQQRAELAQIREAYAPQRQALRQQMRDNRRAQRVLDPTDANYLDDVQRLAQARAALMVEGSKLHAQQRQLMHQQFTDEQRAQIAEWRAQHAQRMQERRGMHRGKGYREKGTRRGS